MNFVCDKCKQKYHVADEKIRGRAVTRFRCKKCENVIELRSDALPDPDAPGAPKQADAPDDRPRPATMAPSSPRPAVTAISGGAIGATAAKPPARTRAATSVGVAFNAGMAATAAKAAPRTASTSAILNASETGWYAGIRDLPVGPLTRKELVAKVQSAEVTPDTLVWREGLDDWRPLLNVAELGDVLRVGAQRISGNLLDEMGRRTPSAPSPAPAEPRRTGQVVPLRQPLATPSAPAVTRPAISDDDEEEATRVTGMDPAIAALIPKALGLEPRQAKAPVEAEDSGDQTLIEPPHSPMGRSLGLDGPNKVGLRAPVAKAPPPKAPTPAAPARPAPPKAPQSFNQPRGATPPAAPPAVVEKPASVPPVALTIESSPSLNVSSAPPPAPIASDVAPAPAPLSSLPPEDGDLPEDLFGRKPFPPQSNAPSLESFGLSAAFSSSVPPPNSMPAPAVAPMALAPPQPTSLVPVAQPPSKQGGLSLPVIILMLGVLVLGVFGGVVLAGRLNRPTPQPVPAPVRVVQPTVAPVAPPVPAAPGPEVAIATPEPAVDPAPTSGDPNGAGGHPRTGHRPTTAAAARPPGGAISAAQAERDRLALIAALGQGGPSGGPVNTTRLPSQNTGAQDNSPAQSGSARAGRAVQNFSSARIVNGCWQNLLRMNPSVQPVRVNITLQIGTSGRITSATVNPSPDPTFTRCINSGVGRVAPVSPGEAVGAELAVNLTSGG